MRKTLSALAIAAAGYAAVGAPAAFAGPAPDAARNQPLFANAHWDDEERHRFGPMPVPNADAIRKAGIVDVVEIERDDGRIEVEGYDARGRKIELRMDGRGQRVLSVRRDADRGD